MFLARFFKKTFSSQAGIRSFVISTLFLLFAVVFWPWLFYYTQQATEENTYEVQVEIDRVQVIHNLSHSKLYIYAENICYECDVRYIGVDRESEAIAAAERIEKLDSPVTLTVLPRHILFSLRFTVPVERQVIELQKGTEIMWGVKEYNSGMRFIRGLGLFTGILFSSTSFVLFYFHWFVLYKPTKRKKKRKR